MSFIDANNIQNLLEKIEALKKTLESTGDGGESKLIDIDLYDRLDEIPRAADGTFDAKKWNSFGEEKQQELHSRLNCLHDDLKAAAGLREHPKPVYGYGARLLATFRCILHALKGTTDPGAQAVPKQVCGYGATLIATLIFLPSMATFFTIIIILFGDLSIEYVHTPVWGMFIGIAAWLVLGGFCCKVADAKHAIPSSYGEILPRLDGLAVGLKDFCPATGGPLNPCTNAAYREAVKENYEIRKELAKKGLTWLLATEYSKVWRRLYRAEEAMIEIVPQKKVLEAAYYDEARLDGSDIRNRDDLLVKLRNAVVSIDPSAHKYLKSTAAIPIPPALAIGTTALPGGTVAVGYCVSLLAAGGVPPYKWAVIGGAIPDGMNFSTMGVLHGTPLNDGRGNFTVQVTDRAGVAVEKYFDLLIGPQTQVPPPALAISTISPLPGGAVGVDYTERLFATGGKPPYTWTVSAGEKPDGMDLSNEGVLSGRPLKDNQFKFTAAVADSVGTSPMKREFTLLIKPSDTGVIAPAGGTQPTQLARVVLRYVRNSLNEYRNARWNGVILARNRLLATFMLTSMIVFALLTIAIMDGAARSTIIAATVFYLVGATVGLCNRLRSESQAEAAIADYGLSAARLITIPLFSGLGAIGGLLFVAYLPFATPVLAPDIQTPKGPSQETSVVGKGAPPAPAPAAGAKETTTGKASVPEAGTVKTSTPPAPAPPAGAKEMTTGKAPVPATGTVKTSAPQGPAPETDTVKKEAPPAPAAGNTNTPTATTSAPQTGTEKKNEKKLPPPPTLGEIFDLRINLIGLFIAAVFGLTPGLLFDRLQQQADRYKAELKSSQATEGAKKS